MDEAITRRDFLGSVLLASGAVLLESASPAELAADNFTGYGGVGEYSNTSPQDLCSRKSKQVPQIPASEHGQSAIHPGAHYRLGRRMAAAIIHE